MKNYIVLFILIALAVITAAAEISIIVASRIKMKKLASGGSKAARIALRIIELPERFFGTILVVNNIVDTLIAVIVTAMIMHVIGDGGKWGIVLATLIASFLIIIPEVTAKTFAARYSERMALILAIPVRALIVIFSPVVKIVEAITKGIVVLLGGDTRAKQSLVTEEEIKALIKIGEEEGVLHKEKLKMLSKVFDFSEAIVKNVMTPKKDIVSININSSFDDILDKALESGYSRLPVYKDNPDEIIGMMNMKDLLSVAANKGLIVFQDIIYPATFFPETKKVSELLKEFQKGHTHLAIINDASGKIFGLVTLEDLLEEIVGEIEDEYDVRANYYKNPK